MSVVAEAPVVDDASSVDELDNLESAIVDDKPYFKMPDKFAGKSAEDIAQSYINLESESGRQRNEIGSLRGTVDQLLELKQKPEPVKQAVDVDTLLDNPDTVINDAVSNNPKLQAIEQKLRKAELKEARTNFESNHPDWQKTVGSKEFQNWVNGSNVRKKMFEAADKRYNYEVAGELFSNYEEIAKVRVENNQQERETRRNNGLKNASSNRGVQGGGKRKMYRRVDLVNLRISDPAKYEAMYPEIYKAYAEGRVK